MTKPQVVTTGLTRSILWVGVLFVGLLAVAAGTVSASSPHSHVALITLEGVIDPISADYVSRALNTAADREAALAIILLDTPGGLLNATRDIVEDILASDMPVVVFVSPAGSQAASAGTFVLAAGDLAAMAPYTNVGSASPVGQGGEDLPETLASKATQDASAFLRSIAESRGRNGPALEATVLESISYSAAEAFELEIVDLIAPDVESLLTEIHGWTIEFKGSPLVIDVNQLPTKSINRNALEQFLRIIANPNIALLLLSIGGFGILIEFFNPGGFVAGIFGVIALVLAFVALGNMPTNWTGVGLIVLAIALFYVELQAPGLSVPGIAGGISFVLGAFFLFGGFSPPSGITEPSFRVNLWVLVGVSLSLASIMAVLIRTSLRAKTAVKNPPRHEVASVIGEPATVVTQLDPVGTVFALGEEWSAVSDLGNMIKPGESVTVTAVDGLTLKVRQLCAKTSSQK